MITLNNKKKDTMGPTLPMQNQVEKDAQSFKAKNMAENAKGLGAGTYTVRTGNTGYSTVPNNRASNTAILKKNAESMVTPNNVQTQTPADSYGADYYKGVLSQGMTNKAPVADLMPVWNQYWAQVENNVKQNPESAKYMYDETYRDWMEYTGQDSDIGTQIMRAIARGADPTDVELLLAQRDYKIFKNPYLAQYAYDEVYAAAKEYIENNRDKYKNEYENEIAERLANRNKEFKYSVEDDPLYQQYLKQAREQGQMAMEDTLAEAAMSAGGMNSYAIAAAQGMNNNYMQRVNDVIPELYQLAYNKYLNEQNREAEDINLLMALENQDYGRWASERARNDELKTLAYQRVLADEETAYGRGVYEDETAYNREMAEREWNYGIQNDAYNKIYDYVLKKGSINSIPDELIEASGYPKEYWQSLLNGVLANFKSSSKGGDVVKDDDVFKVENKESKNETAEYKLYNALDEIYYTPYTQKNGEEYVNLVGGGTVSLTEAAKLIGAGDVVMTDDNGITRFYKTKPLNGILR